MNIRGASSSSSNGPGLSSVPMIPGMMSAFNSLTGKTHFRRTQALQQMNEGKLIDSTPTTTTTTANAGFFGKFSSTKQDESRATAAATTNGTSTSTKYRTDTTQPSWITNDRQVLRFYGYFKEKVEEKGKEIIRIRRVIICFYLVDGSLSITEPKVENSGLLQGELMKKSIVKKPNGEKFQPKDFEIGGNFQLFSRIFYLVDCDKATREFYQEAMGLEQQEAIKYPDDVSSKMDEIDFFKQSQVPPKASFSSANKFENMKKFQENAQKVLRFFVTWQDPHPLYPETRRYVLHYYLSDDTIEIVEPKEERSGRGHFAILLSRRKAKKETKAKGAAGISSTISSSSSQMGENITEKDLRCGEFIQLYSRKFFLEDCDPFTRDFYLETHGITQEKMETIDPIQQKRQLQQEKIEKELLKQDQASLFGKLVAPKPEVTKNFHQTESLDKKTLRFRAKFFGLKKDDINFVREFVLTFFLEDDTMSVYEPPVKNSGVVGGRFLDRGRFMKCSHQNGGDSASREKQKQQSPYKASDFYIGAVISFEFSPNQKLELIEADAQTLLFCESHPEQFIYSNADIVIENVAEAIAKQKIPIRLEFQRIDTRCTRLISIEGFKQVLQRNRLTQGLNPQQIVTLYRRFLALEGQDKNQSNQVAYDEFCDAIESVLAGESSSSSSSSAITQIKTAIPRLRHLLTRVDNEKDGLISVDEFSQITSFHKVKLSSRELAELQVRFEHPKLKGQGQMDYQALCDYIFDGADGSYGNDEEDPFERPQSAIETGRSWDLSDFDEERAAPAHGTNAGFTGRGSGSGGNILASKVASMNLGIAPGASAGRIGSSDPFSGYLSKINKTSGVISAQRTAANALNSVTSPYASAALNKPSMNLAPAPAPAPVSVAAAPRQGFATSPRVSFVKAPATVSTTTATSGSNGGGKTDQRVVDLLHRLFGTRKYQLRKALRERDATKSGILGEDEFMDAILSLEPNLSDDDTYLIADVYFPKNDSTIDYSKLLESAFRT